MVGINFASAVFPRPICNLQSRALLHAHFAHMGPISFYRLSPRGLDFQILPTIGYKGEEKNLDN